MAARIIRVFLNVSMINGHDGLHAVAKKEKVDLGKLEPGELVIFLNERADKLKVYGANDVYAYYRSPKGRLQAEMIQNIPKSFSGGRINFDEAVKTALLDLLAKKKPNHLVV